MSLILVVLTLPYLKIDWFYCTKSQKSSGFIVPFSKIEQFHGTTRTTTNASPDQWHTSTCHKLFKFSDEILGSYFYHYLRKLDVYRNQFYMQLWNLNPKGLTKYCPRQPFFRAAECIEFHSCPPTMRCKATKRKGRKGLHSLS